MKNLTYMPFKKNRYFYGKLLTSEDFEQEQQYFDDKRRLINRWVLGAGIVAGLDVIRVDDYNISVEMGLALDYTGREIVVDMPVIRRLSLLDGYEEATAREGDESLYLCIEYDQIPVEPVHNITNHAVHTNEEECHNKYRESYHLYVTDEEPVSDEVGGDFCSLWSTIRSRAEVIHQGTYRQGIYLAKIGLVKAGEFYMIEEIRPMTDRQYVMSQPVTAGILQHMKRELEELRQSFGRLVHLGAGSGEARPEQGDSDWQFEQGQVSVPVPAGGKPGACYFSEEIAHGLGLGDVELMVHVIQGNFSYGGAEDIFAEEEKSAEAACCLSRNTGTFRVGVRLLTPPEGEEIRVGWTAVRRRSRNEIRQEEPRIFISPGMVNLKTRESIRLEAVCVNMLPEDLVWHVVTPDGGTVEPDGTYFAPNLPGVYQVDCKKNGQERLKASVYIVVRE